MTDQPSRKVALITGSGTAVGGFQMVRACVPHLKAVQGSVVKVSSIAGSLGMITSRWFVEGLGHEGFDKVKAMVESASPLQRASPSRLRCEPRPPKTSGSN